MDSYRVVQHLVREPWKSRGARVGAGAGLDMYRVVKHLVREPCKSQGPRSRGRCRIEKVKGSSPPGEGAM